MELKGKNVFVTGSTRGIGKAVALAFAKEGANIVLNGRGEISTDLIAEVESYDVKCVGISGDIASFESAGEMIQAAIDGLGSIDILINNAGITNDKLLLRMSEEDFTRCIQINLTGTFNMTQQAIKRMMKQRSGRIINMSSVSGLIGNIGQANYAASKAGVIGFTKSVAREVAARGITCNAIAPGFIETEMTDVLSDKVKEQMNQQIPLQKFGQVEDIANAAIFLAKSPYVTGQVLNVDGGLVMHG
ncbi:3-oxoacyl-[acyl-carrier-protein] reductase [Enterococcus haemoperoxidus ATCC BAA-382]|uniref:3-oxoacyl-[acyl-carrier-protein] reductase n=1 Tax=Enterococcus haemoperoxidus ATCC BAA-382 TaxID=1158608 RepID=R2T537_9ENTE|nr:3-oxoacyl-[acyl-carrier-protein] reductase [Enterococcus haemoperoxidus]EOI00129.1 3-oxoacyl-[acyl-carrier-protein] reductase [Enterococcus haemoperoxidus ATCC BAA-382]EOT63173.1 3-oxoacyl-[acyl-carrier-protein] reductase [Enterococcus haemoperoxidus ATCC BAA-382]OJG50740.1 3-oxoacyl-[acyl-carrier-protein] reductase [Enterococcus haemoperoxidus]